MAGYPLVLSDLARARCVVIGGGEVAARKISGLIAGGACPIVISPTLHATLHPARDAGLLVWQARRYAAGDLANAFLVIAATDDPAVNAQVVAEAAARNILVNSGDDGSQGNFHTVAAVRRGDLLLAVSTGSASPALTVRIRRELEAQYGEQYAALLHMLRVVREGPAAALPAEQRARLLRRLVADDVLALVQEGALDQVAALVRQQVAAQQPQEEQ